MKKTIITVCALILFLIVDYWSGKNSKINGMILRKDYIPCYTTYDTVFYTNPDGSMYSISMPRTVEARWTITVGSVLYKDNLVSTYTVSESEFDRSKINDSHDMVLNKSRWLGITYY